MEVGREKDVEEAGLDEVGRAGDGLSKSGSAGER